MLKTQPGATPQPIVVREPAHLLRSLWPMIARARRESNAIWANSGRPREAPLTSSRSRAASRWRQLRPVARQGKTGSRISRHGRPRIWSGNQPGDLATAVEIAGQPADEVESN